MSDSKPNISEMLATITKTFIIAHDKDSDERLAQALVFNAGRLGWRMRELGVETDFKTSISDVVTDADRAAEDFIVNTLEVLRPEDGVLGEEGSTRASKSGRTWVIDPIDGTYNFTQGSDYWCSALALVEGSPSDPDRPVFGAVHRPAMGYTWFGGPEIPTTRDSAPLPKLIDAHPKDISLATYIHPKWLVNGPTQATWIAVSSQFATIRMLGAGSVDLAGVAEGVYGVWLQHSVADWDWLPGRALVEGVGGKCVKVDSGGVTWCLAGNQLAVEEVSEVLKQVL